MTARIRAHVAREPDLAPRPGLPWAALAWVEDPDEPDRASFNRMAWLPSWPEAMQEAQVMRSELDELLMNEVHASRARRRTPVVIGPEQEPTA